MSAFPLCIIWYGYGIPLTEYQLLQMTGVPTFFLLFRVEMLLTESIDSTIDINILQKYRKSVTQSITENDMNGDNCTIDVGRKSKFSEMKTFSEDLISKQIKSFEYFKCLRIVMTIWVPIYVIFLIIQIIMLVSVISIPVEKCAKNNYQHTLHDKIIWDGCTVKIPTCQLLADVSCNCAKLHLTGSSNGESSVYQNITSFPPIFAEMTHLKRMQFSNGKLMKIPDTIANDKPYLVYVNLQNNSISSLPSKMPSVIDFDVSFNKLKKIPESIWSEENLLALFADYNSLQSISANVNLPYLQVLWLGHNNISNIPDSITDSLDLEEVYLDWNNVKTISEKWSNLKRLRSLFLNGNGIQDISSNIATELKDLTHFDVRNNSIATLPTEFEILAGKNILTLSGNPICANQNGPYIEECVPHCSDFCNNMDLGDAYCDARCNSKSCNFDEGDCL